MKPAALFREAWRNISTGTARTVLFAVLLSTIVTGLVAAELWSVHTMTAAADAFRKAGAATMTLSAAGRVDGAACEALVQVPGVRAAGALRSVSDGIVASSLPSSKVPLFEVTPGLPSVLNVERRDRQGITLSYDVAETLGVKPGGAISTPGGAVPVADVYAWPDDGRKPGYGYAILADVPSAGVFDECWVDAWPVNAQTGQLLRMTLLPGGDQVADAKMSQLNTTLGVAFDGARQFEQRLTRWASIVALLAGGGLGYVSVRLRRLAHAATLHAGVARRDLTAIITLETASWVVPALGFAAATVGLGLRFAAPGDTAVIAMLGGTIITFAIIGVALGVTWALLTTREHHFFTYFQER